MNFDQAQFGGYNFEFARNSYASNLRAKSFNCDFIFGIALSFSKKRKKIFSYFTSHKFSYTKKERRPTLSLLWSVIGESIPKSNRRRFNFSTYTPARREIDSDVQKRAYKAK